MYLLFVSDSSPSIVICFHMFIIARTDDEDRTTSVQLEKSENWSPAVKVPGFWVKVSAREQQR